MRVLIGCEVFGVVRDAFLARGHDATSCDLQETRVPGPHIQADLREVIRRDPHYDLLIAHPPCTNLAVSGARHFAEKRELQEADLDLVSFILHCSIPKIALENPVSIISTRIRPPDQIIHPFYFGDPEQKTTCLWLKGLLPLHPTCIVRPGRSSLHDLGPSPERGMLRSKTFQGFAEAMAAQWGDLEFPEVALPVG
jgi:site-specific DNA-cytosine methylase